MRSFAGERKPCFHANKEITHQFIQAAVAEEEALVRFMQVQTDTFQDCIQRCNAEETTPTGHELEALAIHAENMLGIVALKTWLLLHSWQRVSTVRRNTDSAALRE